MSAEVSTDCEDWEEGRLSCTRMATKTRRRRDDDVMTTKTRRGRSVGQKPMAAALKQMAAALQEMPMAAASQEP